LILLELPDVLAVAVRVVGDDLPRDLDQSYEMQRTMLEKVRRGIADVATGRKRVGSGSRSTAASWPR
jgi:hypothetical protein